jgi:tetratricopeptide (TPR) repeat protein
LAEVYVRQGRYADAYTSLQQTREIYISIQAEHDIAEVKGPFGHLLVKVGLFDAAEKELHDAEHTATEAHADNLVPQILLARSELALLRGHESEAAEGFRQANFQANLSGQKEVAVESRIQLGRLYLLEGQLTNAERLLTRTKDEAAKSRLRPLESEAAAALADVHLVKGDAEAARQAALEAISIAEKFSGRPALHHAYASLGEALEKLGRSGEALDAYAKAASNLEWMRGSLLSEHVESFMGRADLQAFLARAADVLEKGGRIDEAADLKKWIRTKSPETEI